MKKGSNRQTQTGGQLALENFRKFFLAGETISGSALEELIAPVGFSDAMAAIRNLRRLAALDPRHAQVNEIFPHLLAALSVSANPDQTLINFERFVMSWENRSDLFHKLAENPRAIEILIILFAGSQFLTEILLSNPDYLELVEDREHLAQPMRVEQFITEAQAGLAKCHSIEEQLDRLRRYQRRELLRTGVSDLMDLFDLPAVTWQLSNLAQALVQVCLDQVCTSAGWLADGFIVLALGKLGGQELNYSSDIDLLFLSSRDPQIARRIGEKLIEALSKITSEGFLYRVDMRLRPWGRVGILVPTLEGYLAYWQQHARLWEKQAFLKARPIAGDLELGRQFLRRLQSVLFAGLPSNLRNEVYGMKLRTEETLRQQGREWGELKLGIGSIRDIEFLTQYLQLSHGERLPNLLSPNTLSALQQLAAHRLLTHPEAGVLVDGYIFLRTVEHFVQMMHYQQTDQLPLEPQALHQLARRLGFLGPQAGQHFQVRYQQHCQAIRAVYLAYLGDEEGPANENTLRPAGTADIPRHLLRMHPSYALAFTPEEIAQQAALAEKLTDENLVEVQVAPMPAPGREWRITIVAYDFPGELSIICGLLFAYHLNILDGKVFTYEPQPSRQTGERSKIVDVFTLVPMAGDPDVGIWSRYQSDLYKLFKLAHTGQPRRAYIELAGRVAAALSELNDEFSTLYPIEINIDNSISKHYTVLQIQALDTPGFLYELTNALAFHKIYIARMSVGSTGRQVFDTLHITDANRGKILDPEKQRELRAAVVLIKHFTHLLPLSPNPESALLHFREFIEQLFKTPNWPDELASLERPQVLAALAKLLGVSNFLWDDFLRMQYTHLFPLVRDVDELHSPKTKHQIQVEMQTAIQQEPDEWRKVLNAYKDRELFRVDMRHILEHTQEFEQFSHELTDLAEVGVECVYQMCYQELASVYGEPTLEDGTVCLLAVCALGKCGGRELGYASDIELAFIYAGNGRSRGPRQISNAEFFEKLVESFLGAVQARQEGIFQIDLQLRPYGKAGSLAFSHEAMRRYYAPNGPAWAYERQALVKLRPIAGDKAFGETIARTRDELVYTGIPFDVTAMRAMRERQVRHFVNAGTFNAKYSPGGLSDIEYLVQGLQITYGQAYLPVRKTNTRAAMQALAEAGLLAPEVHTRLHKAHTFLRWLIDGLRVVRGNAKDLTVPPPNSEEFAFLARRLRYGSDISRLQTDLSRYSADVQAIQAGEFSRLAS